MNELTLTMTVVGLALLTMLATLGGITVFIATELTAKSKLLEPLRRRLIRAAAHATIRRDPDTWRFNKLHRKLTGTPRWYDSTLIFLCDAWTCPFCSTFWHGFWVAGVIGVIGGSFLLAALAYPLSVGTAKLLHDALTRSQHGRGT